MKRSGTLRSSLGAGGAAGASGTSGSHAGVAAVSSSTRAEPVEPGQCAAEGHEAHDLHQAHQAPRGVQRLLIGGIHLYQGARAGRLSPCRFIPSCSAYGEEAIAVHGAAKGSLLTLKRIARCRPGGGFGVDLVPPRT